jgi:hypothetical protein
MAGADAAGGGPEGRRELLIAHVQLDVGLELRALLRRIEFVV